ncbi:MAG: hypothetical protein GY845_19375 [Planctomycetes bacterium]|nr:hypothetical protein [Planctomycetota bacterium]
MGGLGDMDYQIQVRTLNVDKDGGVAQVYPNVNAINLRGNVSLSAVSLAYSLLPKIEDCRLKIDDLWNRVAFLIYMIDKFPISKSPIFNRQSSITA